MTIKITSRKYLYQQPFFSLRWLSVYIGGIIPEIIYHLIINTTYITKHPILQFILSIGADALNIIISFSIIMISIRYITKSYVYKNENITVKETLILVVPSLTAMAGYSIMQCYQTYFDKAAVEAISGIYNGLALLYYGISIITIVAMIVIFQNIKVRQEDKLQNELLDTQVNSIRRHIEQVESLYKDIYSIRHDMAKHIITLEKLYSGNKTEEARAYSADLKAALAKVTGEIKSGNPVTDVILQEFKNEAEKKKINFCSDFHYPTGFNANAFDISIILNNALQNAVENTKKCETSYIHIVSYRRNNAFIIEVSNSFTGKLKWNAENELPVTSKVKTEGHGYGLENIRKIADKYFGDIDINLKNQKFCLSIMLMLE